MAAKAKDGGVGLVAKAELVRSVDAMARVGERGGVEDGGRSSGSGRTWWFVAQDDSGGSRAKGMGWQVEVEVEAFEGGSKPRSNASSRCFCRFGCSAVRPLWALSSPPLPRHRHFPRP